MSQSRIKTKVREWIPLSYCMILIEEQKLQLVIQTILKTMPKFKSKPYYYHYDRWIEDVYMFVNSLFKKKFNKNEKLWCQIVKRCRLCQTNDHVHLK